MNLTEYQLLHQFLKSAGPLSDDLFEEVSKYVRKRTFKKGELILKQGETESYSNVVVKGVVLQYLYDEGVPITLNITPKSFPFNSLKSYVDGSPSVEIQEAVTDVEILSVKKEDLEMLAKKHHEFSYIMYKIHEHIMLDRENRMFLLQYRNPAKRFLLFHEVMERANWILEDTPDKYIASYLNMTPQQYCKEKKNYYRRLEKVRRKCSSYLQATRNK